MHDIAKILTQFCIAKGIEATKERIEINATALLKRYSKEQITKALSELFWETKFFPDVSDIAKKINSSNDPQDQANEMVGKILHFGSRISEFDQQHAKNKLGVVAWKAIEMFGGWTAICRLNHNELGTARAQLREICKTVCKLNPGKGIEFTDTKNLEENKHEHC